MGRLHGGSSFRSTKSKSIALNLFGCGRHVQESKNTSFELASKNLGMAPEAVRAGKLLDAALESQNMSVDGTGYFNILVNVFSQVGRVEKFRRW